MGLSVLKLGYQIVPQWLFTPLIINIFALQIWQNYVVVVAENNIGYMEANYITGDHDHHKKGDDDDNDDELLNTRISSHPLYGRLVQNHLNCLKVGIGNRGRDSKRNQRNAVDYNYNDNINNKKKNLCSSSSMQQLNQSELDVFMEGYCSALSKLKEAMEEPQQETLAFINAMHSQLRDLSSIPINPLSFSPDHHHHHLFLQETEAGANIYKRGESSNAVD